MDNQSESNNGPRERGSMAAWGVVAVVLALAIIGLSWYVYPRLRQQSAAIDALRKAQSTAEQATSQTPATTLNPAEQQLHDQFSKLEQGFTKLKRNGASRIASVRKQAHQASKDAFQRAQALIDMRIHSMEARLARMESSNASEDARVAALTTEIGQMRQQIAQQAGELQSVRRQVYAGGARETRQIAELKRGEERDRKDVDAVNSALAMQRVDFEVTRDHTSEVAPGVYLHIDRANPSFSNVDGWMRVMPQDRMFWMHRQNVDEPVIFYRANDKKQCELVLTAMRGNSVKGFLMMPEPQPAQIASARLGQ
jgi:hypothetical protein